MRFCLGLVQIILADIASVNEYLCGVPYGVCRLVCQLLNRIVHGIAAVQRDRLCRAAAGACCCPVLVRVVRVCVDERDLDLAGRRQTAVELLIEIVKGFLISSNGSFVRARAGQRRSLCVLCSLQRSGKRSPALRGIVCLLCLLRKGDQGREHLFCVAQDRGVAGIRACQIQRGLLFPQKRCGSVHIFLRDRALRRVVHGFRAAVQLCRIAVLVIQLIQQPLRCGACRLKRRPRHLRIIGRLLSFRGLPCFIQSRCIDHCFRDQVCNRILQLSCYG